MSAERDKTANVTGFPPMTDLAHFHDVIGKLSDSVGDDHDDVPLAIIALVLRPGDIEQFSLVSPDQVLALMGALDVAKISLMEEMMGGEE